MVVGTASVGCPTGQCYRRSSPSKSFARILSTPGDDVVVQLTATTDSLEEANVIATALLERRLVACVQIAGPVTSRFWWQGTLDSAAEHVLVAKTTAVRAEAATTLIVETHSYDVPEVLVTPVVGGNPAYLEWVANEVR